MRKTKHDWAGHVAAITAQGISPIAYAKQHGLVQSTLYRWLQKLQATSTSAPGTQPLRASAAPAKFIALRLSEPEHRVSSPSSVPTHCTLTLPSGVRLEMSALPTPQWLADLARCAHGVH
jgi:transposase-like protein